MNQAKKFRKEIMKKVKKKLVKLGVVPMRTWRTQVCGKPPTVEVKGAYAHCSNDGQKASTLLSLYLGTARDGNCGDVFSVGGVLATQMA